ncbi:MAG: hypothetical protein U0Y68_17390 [Blastocatellia bacterium]
MYDSKCASFRQLYVHGHRQWFHKRALDLTVTVAGKEVETVSAATYARATPVAVENHCLGFWRELSNSGKSGGGFAAACTRGRDSESKAACR